MSQKYQKKLKPKRMPCNKSTKLQFQSTRKILMLSKRYESTEVERRTWLHVPSGKLWSTSSDTHQVSEVMCACQIYECSVTVSAFKWMEKKLGERREKWGAMHRLVVSWDYLTVTLGGLMLLYYMEGGGGGVWWSTPGGRNFGRICAELWFSEPTWTKNSAYRTVPFLDFWVLEWYWNYNRLFWKLMKSIGCWMVGCIPSECFELTHKLFKLVRRNNLNIWICRFLSYCSSILIGERSEPENFVENEHFMCQFPW